MTPDRYRTPTTWRAPAPQPPPSTLAQQDAIYQELNTRLGWTDARRAAYLANRWGYTHVTQLNTLQAAAFLIYLQEQQP